MRRVKLMLFCPGRTVSGPTSKWSRSAPAGTGPSCFDCSGLTMMAWGAGGLTLPHFSGAQFAMFPQVPLTQLVPGDLVFPADPNQHVGIYVGNGLMVHATTPGDVVKYAPLGVVGITLAVRPT